MSISTIAASRGRSGCANRTSAATCRAGRLPADHRCYGFAYDALTALASRTSAGWSRIGWVAANSGRQRWDAWDNVETDDGRLGK